MELGKPLLNSFFRNVLLKASILAWMALAFSPPSYAFEEKNNPQLAHSQETVVLIHGLIRTTFSMIFLKHFLEKQGYHVYNYGYPSTRYTIKQHSITLNKFIEKQIRDNPTQTIHFVTHSLGGIILRDALARRNKNQLRNIGHIVMLAPPNQGSFYAKLTTEALPILDSLIKPLPELSEAPKSYIRQLPPPNVKLAIIAGRYDAKVPPAYARLEGVKDFAIVNAAHTFIMNNSTARQLIKEYLQSGSFDAVKHES